MRWMIVLAVLSLAPGLARADDGDPKSAELRAKASELMRDGDDGAALTQLRAAEKLTPNDPTTLKMLGGCFARMGRFPEAAAAYRKFLAVAPPDDPSVPTIHKAVQDYDASDDAHPKRSSTAKLSQWKKLEPPVSVDDEAAGNAALARHDYVAALHVAQRELRNGNNEASVALLTQIAAQNPNDPDTERSLAGALARKGDFKNAAVHYRKFLEIAPNDPSAPAIRQALKDYDQGNKK